MQIVINASFMFSILYSMISVAKAHDSNTAPFDKEAASLAGPWGENFMCDYLGS